MLAFFRRRIVLGILVTAVLALMFTPLVGAYVEQRMALAAARQEVTDRQAAIEKLDADITRWEDPAYVKQQARERLMFVMPGDTQYLVVDDTPGRQGGYIPDPDDDEDTDQGTSDDADSSGGAAAVPGAAKEKSAAKTSESKKTPAKATATATSKPKAKAKPSKSSKATATKKPKSSTTKAARKPVKSTASSTKAPKTPKAKATNG